MRYLLVPAAALILTSCNDKGFVADATGYFEAVEVTVSAEATGRIVALDITEGSSVDEGAVVGCIDTVQLSLKKEQLKASLRSVRSRRPDTSKQIASLEQQLETARTERERTRVLVESDAASRKSLDDADALVKVLERELSALKTTLAQSSRGVDAEAESITYQILQIDDMISRSVLKSPITGTILSRYAERGELASAGKPLYKIADVGNIILRAYITASQLSQIKTGGTVRVFTDFGEGERREYRGVTEWVSDKSEFTPKGVLTKDERENLVYAVKISVVNDGYIKIGQYGEIKL